MRPYSEYADPRDVQGRDWPTSAPWWEQAPKPWPPRGTPESAPHDYEPGDAGSPMQTDPSCHVCGEGRHAAVHT